MKEVKIRKGIIEIELKEKIYPRDVVATTVYLFSDRFNVIIDKEGRGILKVKLISPEIEEEEADQIVKSFFSNLTDALIRYRLERHTARIREYILARAFWEERGEPSYLEEKFEYGEKNSKEEIDTDKELEELLKEIEEEDFSDKVVDIVVPWEEKYGDKKD